jgi:hypothetical protein
MQMLLRRQTATLGLIAVVCGTGNAQPRVGNDTTERLIVLLVARTQNRGQALFFGDRSANVAMQSRTDGVGGCAADLLRVRYESTPTAPLRALVESARYDFCRRNAQQSTFPPATVAAVRSVLSGLPAQAEPGAPVWPFDRCRANPVVEVTRVGFDSTRSVMRAARDSSRTLQQRAVALSRDMHST